MRLLPVLNMSITIFVKTFPPISTTISLQFTGDLPYSSLLLLRALNRSFGLGFRTTLSKKLATLSKLIYESEKEAVQY